MARVTCFRLYPEPGRSLFYHVRLFPTQDALRDYLRADSDVDRSAAFGSRALCTRWMRTRTLPTGWDEALPSFDADEKGLATRKASGDVLGALAPVLPELWGGSADLAESNNTTMEGEPSFIPPDYATKAFPGDWYGRTLHFGIREHGMGAILNGIVLHGGTRPFGGTFLIGYAYLWLS